MGLSRRIVHSSSTVSGVPDWHEVDWVAHSRSARVEDRTIHYIDVGAGPGPAFVFFHGIGNSWRMWGRLMPHLSNSSRCIAVDLPGFGASPAPPDAMHIDRISFSIASFCGQVAGGPVIACGHSLGGLVAAHLASFYPDVVARLVMMSSPPLTALTSYRSPMRALRRDPDAVLSFMALMAAALLPFRGALIGRVLDSNLWRRRFLGRYVADPDTIDAATARFILGDFGNGRVMSAARNGFGYPASDVYGEITASTSAIMGGDDSLIPESDISDFLEMTRGDGVLHIVEACGHLPMVEAAPTVASILRNLGVSGHSANEV